MLINEIRNYDLKDFQIEKKELKELKEKANSVNLSKCKDRPFLLKDYYSDKGRVEYSWSIFSVCSLAAMFYLDCFLVFKGLAGIGMIGGLLTGLASLVISILISKNGTETKTWILGFVLALPFFIIIMAITGGIENVIDNFNAYGNELSSNLEALRNIALIGSMIASALYVIIMIAITVIRNGKVIVAKAKELYNAYLYRGMDKKE